MLYLRTLVVAALSSALLRPSRLISDDEMLQCVRHPSFACSASPAHSCRARPLPGRESREGLR
eukprot:5705324-Alexandrium_andersonii.AAC.1